MIDYFALLDEPRRPWLEPDPLKSKFLALSAKAHPDRFHGQPETERQAATQRYTELNAAYTCLREPKERLQHLLQLELGAKPRDVQRIPPETMELFLEVGSLSREVDGFLAEREKVVSPLLRVQWFERSQEWTDRLSAMQRKLNGVREGLVVELQGMNRAWESAPPVGVTSRASHLPLEQLEEVFRAFSYLVRWSGQIQERIVQLSL